MELRLASEEDLEPITAIYNHAIASSTATFDTQPVTQTSRRHWLTERNPQLHPVIVAVIDGDVAGWAALSPWSNRCAYARAAEVSIYVADDFQRRGVGAALLEALIERGRTARLGVLLARISSGEGPASSRLHEKLGFDRVGRMHRVGEKFGRLLDVDLYERHLDAGISSQAASDRELLAFYLSLGASESKWNHSSEFSGIDYRIKTWFEDGCSKDAQSICNIGIGAGAWDDYLGYARPDATITSVDISIDICNLLQHRQSREGHANPAAVHCLDVLKECPPEKFDVVTIIGSTVHETGNYERALESAASALTEAGALFYSDFHRFHPPSHFEKLAGALNAEITKFQEDPELGVFCFWARPEKRELNQG